ncbi:MAG: fructose 1,6-bisphosphatase [Nitrospiraceae bacterium]
MGPRDMFDDPSYDEAWRDANRVADVIRIHGPFEPHRLPLDEMECTTMLQIVIKLEGRWRKYRGNR